MDPGHADVHQALDIVAEDFSDDRGFLSYREVTRSGGHNQDCPGRGQWLSSAWHRQMHRPGELIPDQIGKPGSKHIGDGWGCAGTQKAAAGSVQALANR